MKAKTWEETVMPIEEGMNESLRIQMVKILKAQAELSFKAGQEETERRHFKAGIQEVVEWIEEHEESTCMDCSCAYEFRKDEWRAQLKEWGMDTPTKATEKPSA